MASAFITVAQQPTRLQNPNYREDEFAFYLEDLTAKAIVLELDMVRQGSSGRQGLQFCVSNKTAQWQENLPNRRRG